MLPEKQDASGENPTSSDKKNDGIDSELSSTERPAQFSDEDLALALTGDHHSDLKYVSDWGRWQIWNGKRWSSDNTLRVISLARKIARGASRQVLRFDKAKYSLARSVASVRTVAAIEKLARADRRLASRTEDWDADPWILNTPNGVVDLKTGDILPHARDRYCTKITAVSPEGNCPLWLEFLNEISNGDQEWIKYVQRVLGYSLTGITEEHALFFGWGKGANGKGVLFNTLHHIMGDYSAVASMETFIVVKNERHPTDLAMLRGARVVIAQETEKGQRWAEAKIKALTGGDPITARFMRQDYFTYVPQFKLMIAGNHKPGLRNVDEAIRRRFNLIPFSVTIPKNKRDKKLSKKLETEWPGILAWYIQGCLEWQHIGLAPPATIVAATDDYLLREDALGRFIDECCEIVLSDFFEEVEKLYKSWKNWCDKNGEFCGSVKDFSQNLDDRSFKRMKHPVNRRSCFVGLRLR